MCGRYSFFSKDDIVEERWQAQIKMPLPRHFNAAPTEKLPIILNTDPHAVVIGQWGLVPVWMKSKSTHPLINARAETLTQKPSFRNAVRKHRCLVLADSFFEWDRRSGKKIPYRIFLRNEQPFAFAGIWELHRTPGGATVPTFSIVTVPSNDLISPLHDRMPAILQPESEQLWLDPSAAAELALATLRPYGSDLMSMYPVSAAVNSVRNDSPEVIRPDRQIP
ncbi:MAG: SOS response-associated peptidase [Patescibacteria group bacterium]